MDKQYSVQFFTSFVEAMQKFCREYIDFEQCVELSGYLAVEIDNHKKERYVLSEMLQSSGNVISESYCTKAFKTLRKEPTASAASQVDAENLSPNHHRSVNRKFSLASSPGMNVPVGCSPDRERTHTHQGVQSSVLNRRRQNFIHTNQRMRKCAILNSRLNPPSQTVVHQTCVAQIGARTPSQMGSNSPDGSISLGQKRSAVDSSCTQSRSPIVKKDKVHSRLDDVNSVSNSTSETEADCEGMSTAAARPDTANTGLTTVTESICLPGNLEIKKESDPDIPYMVIDNPLAAECDLATPDSDNLFDSVDASSSGTMQLDTSAIFAADLQDVSSSDGGSQSVQVGLSSSTQTNHQNESSMGIIDDFWSNQMSDRRMILTQQEEQQFCSLLCSTAANGISLSRALVLQMASEFAVSSGKRGHKQGVSRQWYYKFLERWPEMRLVISGRIDTRQTVGPR